MSQFHGMARVVNFRLMLFRVKAIAFYVIGIAVL